MKQDPHSVRVKVELVEAQLFFRVFARVYSLSFFAQGAGGWVVLLGGSGFRTGCAGFFPLGAKGSM